MDRAVNEIKRGERFVVLLGGHSAFQSHRDRVPATQAQRGDSAPSVAALHFIKHCRQNPRTGLSNCVAQGDCTSVDVHFLGIKIQFADDCHYLHRESFI